MKKINKIGILLLVLGVLTASMASAANIATDPMRIGVGARVLGMGKAYVAMAEDGDAIFMNPAGLGNIDSLKVSSMYSNLMGDVSYAVLGGAYPNGDMGALGGGIIYSGTSLDLWDGSGASLGSGSWNSNLLFLSYGLNLRDIGITTMLGDLNVGANLKYFSRGGAGNATIEAASGTGMDMDLGFLMTPAGAPWLNVGIVQQNLLQGNITNGYGVADKLPSITKVGAKVGILGKEDKALVSHDQKLDAVVDVDAYLVQSGIPSALHVGLEYWPIKVLALRAGMDQDPSTGGVVSNYTAGVGLRYGGVEFNYAYHPYNGLGDDATSFFSLSYIGVEKAPVLAPFKVSLKSPQDRSMIYDEFVAVEGVIEGENVVVSANGISIPVVEGKFSAKVPVDKLGKKLVSVQASDSLGNRFEKDFRIIRLASFVDVGDGFWAKSPIEHTGTVGLIQGYPDGTFNPGRALTRAELATLIVRAKGIETPKVFGKIFTDVDPGHWAAPYIKVAKAYGWVEGYPDKSYKPNQEISRTEAITILSRLDDLAIKEKVLANLYKDMPNSHWAARYVEAAKMAGLLDYITADTLEPKQLVSRAEFVEMLAKTEFAGRQIDDLLSWFIGFEKI